MSKADERVFQNEVIESFIANGWLLGDSKKYNRELALYEEDLVGFVSETQPKEWAKYQKFHGDKAPKNLAKRVAEQMRKTNPNSSDRELRSYGTLGVLRKGVTDTACQFKICQFKPEHDLNPDTLARYEKNRLRVVPELVYSPYATEEHFAATGLKAKQFRIDLVLFINGLPLATLELKSEFKQSVDNAIRQYKTTRFSVDQITKKAEPLLTFKCGALVHFAVSQWQVYMCTRLAGNDSFFLPFNKGTADGGSGNEIPADPNRYATDYLWNEVLQPDHVLSILAHFIHLEIKEKEDARGIKYKQESLIFPRYHQWHVVGKLVNTVKAEGAGHRYLIQHSAGSGKSNSIAWTAHRMASLYTDGGEKLFSSVIVVTDRTVLDSQLQDTISQFTDVDGVVGRINRDEGLGSKSEKLAQALEEAKPIIIVTIQTFKFVLDCIEKSQELKTRRFAVIADEAHSSQSGATAKQMKALLKSEESAEEIDDEDEINALVTRDARNLSYFAFTATPKEKTIQLFGRCPDPTQPPSKENKPEAFDVYCMRQAIEEGFILDVLRNYTTYKAAYNLALKSEANDQRVDAKQAKTQLTKWARLHPYNIAQKVQVIVEHYRQKVKHGLHGQAKAMVVTSSRKEAVRYKLEMDKYVREKGYNDVFSLVAFSGDVNFSEQDPDAAALLRHSFTESNMNPGLKGRDMRKAFNTEEFQLMLVANKFQTGFDQPKLCAMYVDKKLGGVECVQTLSRLNRCYPGKEEHGTFVLDFVNDPEEILEAFRTYYKTAELADVSDPNLVHELFEKLCNARIFNWDEVVRFYQAFMNPKKSAAAISNICKPAVDCWQLSYKEAREEVNHKKDMLERLKKTTDDAVLLTNADKDLKDAKQKLDRLIIFKKDLGSYTRFYEFMSQIVNFDNSSLDMLSLFARHLRPMLREELEERELIDLSSVVLKPYRLSKIREGSLMIAEAEGKKLQPSTDLGTGKSRDKQEEFLSVLLAKLNEIFDREGLTDSDLLNYAQTIYGKVCESEKVMDQFKNNTPEQAMLGDYPAAFDEAVMESGEAHQNLMMQLLSNPEASDGMKQIVFEMWQRELLKGQFNLLSQVLF